MATSVTPNLNLLPSLDGKRTGLFLQFTYLQGLDLLTTLAFLLAGVQEGNPLVKAMIGMAGSPLLGLLVIKSLAMGLGVFCWTRQRTLLLKRANTFFAVLVAWNLVCLILGLAARVPR